MNKKREGGGSREVVSSECRNDGVCQHSHGEGKKALERHSCVQASRVGGSLAHMPHLRQAL